MIGDDHLFKVCAGQELVVRLNLIILLGTVEIALCLIEAGLLDRGPHILQIDSVGGQLRGIYLNPYRRLLTAADTDESNARQLRYFLGQARVREIFDLRQRQSLGTQCQRQDRRVRRIRLAVNRRHRQIRRQVRLCGVDRSLDFLFRYVDVQFKRELQDNNRAAVRARRGHLVQPGNLPELPFERRGYRRRHYVRICPRIKRHHLNRGIVDFRKGRNRQLQIGHESC